jgi:hypothetical protein
MSLLVEMNENAMALGVPLTVHIASPTGATSAAFIVISTTTTTAR